MDKDNNGRWNSLVMRETLGIQDVIFIDSKTPFDWDGRAMGRFSPNSKYLVVFNQTLTRSADLSGFHHIFGFYHDYRNPDGATHFSTLFQAYGRMNYFLSNNEPQEEHPIVIYGIPEVYYLACGFDEQGNTFSYRDWYEKCPKRKMALRMKHSVNEYDQTGWKQVDQPTQQLINDEMMNVMPDMHHSTNSIKEMTDDNGDTYNVVRVSGAVPSTISHQRLQIGGVPSKWVVFGNDFNATNVSSYRALTSQHPVHTKYRYRKVPIYDNINDPETFKCYRLVYNNSYERIDEVHVNTSSDSIYCSIPENGDEPPAQRRRLS